MLQQHRKCYSVTHSSMVHDICAEEARVETTVGETKLTFFFKFNFDSISPRYEYREEAK